MKKLKLPPIPEHLEEQAGLINEIWEKLEYIDLELVSCDAESTALKFPLSALQITIEINEREMMITATYNLASQPFILGKEFADCFGKKVSYIMLSNFETLEHHLDSFYRN